MYDGKYDKIRIKADKYMQPNRPGGEQWSRQNPISFQ